MIEPQLAWEPTLKRILITTALISLSTLTSAGGFQLVTAAVILTHFVGVKVTHLG